MATVHNQPSPQSSFGISEFLSKLDALGSYAKRNRFSIQVVPPRKVELDIGFTGDTIEFLAKTVSLPARTFGTTTYRSRGMFALDVPYETTFDPVSITFLGSNDWKPRKFWGGWSEHIQSIDSDSQARGGRPYQMKYYKELLILSNLNNYD